VSVLLVAFALLAAVCNAGSSVLQRKAALSTATDGDGDADVGQVMANQARRPAWYGGIGALIVGFLLQAAALSQGPLAVVEPILVVELPFTLLAGWVVFGARLGGREWFGVAVMTVGVGAALAAADPGHGDPQASGLAWAIALSAAGGVLAGATVVGLRLGGAGRSALLGAVAGAMFGCTATLIASASTTASRHFVAAFTTWQLYTMAGVGIVAVVILQQAFQAGALAAAQPGVTISDPVVSVVLGVFLFQEHLRLGLFIIPEVLGIVGVCAGAILLSRSSLLTTDDRRRKS
jgi:drug/metabolite transporter (DMT)-like permease